MYVSAAAFCVYDIFVMLTNAVSCYELGLALKEEYRLRVFENRV
jgi:hypothetical protein